MSFLFGGSSSELNTLIEKATSEENPIGHTDFALFLQIADKIKAKEVSTNAAIKSLKSRLTHSNPNVQISALKLTDCLVKNSGRHFLNDIASPDFIDSIVSIINLTQNSELRNLALKLIQNWQVSFAGKLDLSYVETVYYQLKREGKPFPQLDHSQANAMLIDTATAPEWSDSDVCMRCRTAFTTFNRKHHCRACGQTFCQSCSSKTTTLPHFGIETDVRVCDGCYDKKERGTLATQKNPTNEYLNDAGEDLDLKRAIEASLKESSSHSRTPSGNKSSKSRPPPKPAVTNDNSDEDADLKAAIQASLKESQANPVKVTPVVRAQPEPSPTLVKPKNEFLSDKEIENMNMFASIIERLEADPSQTAILNDPQIQTMYVQMGMLAPKLAKSVQVANEKYNTFLALEDKIQNGCRTYDRLVQNRIDASLGRGGYQQYAPQQPQYASSQYSNQYGSPQPQQAYAQPTDQYTNAPNSQQPPYGTYAAPVATQVTGGDPYGYAPPTSQPDQYGQQPQQQPPSSSAAPGTEYSQYSGQPQYVATSNPQYATNPQYTPHGVDQQQQQQQQYYNQAYAPPPPNQYQQPQQAVAPAPQPPIDDKPLIEL